MNTDIYVFVEQVNGQIPDITYICLSRAREAAAELGGKVIALLLGSNTAKLASNLAADRVDYIDHPSLTEFQWDVYLQTLAEVFSDGSFRMVLFGDTTIGGELAAGLSGRLNLPLINNCIDISGSKFSAQICGGKVLVDGPLPDSPVLIAMLEGTGKAEEGKSTSAAPLNEIPLPKISAPVMTFRQYIVPSGEDVDITRLPILVSVGRGIGQADNVALAEELAAALGTSVSASRPVIDQGWLPVTRLVGKSGKRVKPKIYLALGISGAPEHAEAITGSDMVIAINTDPVAPIFNLAKFGAEVDMFDLLPVLTEKVLSAKGG